jgi:hypothetical protein
MEAAPPVIGLADTERVLPSKVGPVTVFRNAATTASTGSLVLLLLLLSMLLLVLFLLLLLLSMLLLLVLFLLLLLLSMLLLLLVLVLLLLLLSMLLLGLGLLGRLGLLLLLSMLLFGFGLSFRLGLLLRFALFFALLLLLCIAGSSDSEKQKQSRCTDDSNSFHGCYFHYYLLRTLALTQASCRHVDRIADGFARNEKFYSPVLLPAGGVIVGGYRQSVVEIFCTDEFVVTLDCEFFVLMFSKWPHHNSSFPDVYPGNGVQQPNDIQQPQNDCNDHDAIQN